MSGAGISTVLRGAGVSVVLRLGGAGFRALLGFGSARIWSTMI